MPILLQAPLPLPTSSLSLCLLVRSFRYRKIIMTNAHHKLTSHSPLNPHPTHQPATSPQYYSNAGPVHSAIPDTMVPKRPPPPPYLADGRSVHRSSPYEDNNDIENEQPHIPPPLSAQTTCGPIGYDEEEKRYIGRHKVGKLG